MNNEEKILEFWDKQDIFHKSIKNREGAPFFSFYDGPPFATGKPHYGHILTTTLKDAVLRYWTMKGYQVPRRVGWDCHGLPVENLIEKQLDIKNKKQIEELGIQKFNESCRASVFTCVADFEKTLKRVGRWADYDQAYATLENNYIESVWWVLKQLWDKNLVKKNYRVSPYCPRCGTTLSNFEVNQGYKETKDVSIYVKFKISDEKFKDANFLVWTTTPWTLPGNVALAVNPKLTYCLVKNNNELYVLAKPRLNVLEGEFEIIKEILGQELIGTKYEPIFFDLIEAKPENIENAFQVLEGDFVTAEDGTGVVHINPMHGEDDFNLGAKYKLPTYHLIDEMGKFKLEVKNYGGEFVKEADKKILEDLKEQHIFYKQELVTHEYPYCWRCDTPLIYYAIESWYILVTEFKDKLISNNQKIHWVPAHIREGRFGKWLEGARDWNFARERFWGAPIPIWECGECGRKVCIGSLAELKQLAAQEYDLKDLHRPYIDEVKLKCQCGSGMKRVLSVFDCWFESGSMPYAQWHYPFENKELVEKTYPADFIAEGLDQTRGWFYTLHVIAAALTLDDIGLGKDNPAFKNVIVNGLVLDAQGRKLSKKLKNYPDVTDIFLKYGADALRYFLLASTNIGEEYRFSEDKVKDVWRQVISGLENCFIFYNTYKNEFTWTGLKDSKNILDQWILSRIEKTNKEVDKWMSQYELTKAARPIGEFIEELSNWYIRRSRRRFQKPKDIAEKEEALATLYYVLMKFVKLSAPFIPFLTEYIYQALKTENDLESVHLCDYPQADENFINENLEKQMEDIRAIVNLALAERQKLGIKVRQPLSELKIKNKDLNIDLLPLIEDEINVKKIIFDPFLENKIWLNPMLTEELKEEGLVRELVRQIQQIRKEMKLVPAQRIVIYYQKSDFFDKIILRNKKIILNEVLGDDIIIESEVKGGVKLSLDGQDIFLSIRKI
ncbi:MAG TPA: isoleucine--tRNA ligase [Candidatus Pacearchaeota archaeon]|nr:isoleucine--tRNA ligase [Candidatus Pacearchaeota archaeon]